MRFNLLARRMAAPALGLALAATMAACSSSSTTTAASPSSAPPSSAAASSPAVTSSSAVASSPGQAASGNAKAQITSNWEAFFNGQTSAAKKIALLENGQKFASVINAQAGSAWPARRGPRSPRWW